jgi:peptidyl-prolyl cis-trans isomerase A (cyclophilin A)
VVGGMDVVDKIKAVATGDRGPMQNVPLEPVVIRSAKIVQ